MRYIETCSCGASLEVIYQAPDSEYSRGLKREEKEALKQMATFQESHRVCRISRAASSQDRTREVVDPASEQEAS